MMYLIIALATPIIAFQFREAFRGKFRRRTKQLLKPELEFYSSILEEEEFYGRNLERQGRA